MVENSNYKRRLFTLSILLNVCLLILVVVFIWRKGGLSYISEKIFPEKPKIIENSAPQRSYFYNLLSGIYENMPTQKNDIVFFGDSHFQLIPWSEFLENNKIKNRGIGGDNLEGLIDRADEEISGNEAVIFISAGTNDINENKSPEIIYYLYDSLLAKLKMIAPDAAIRLMPISPFGKGFDGAEEKNKRIEKLNGLLSSHNFGKEVAVVNVQSRFTDENGYLKEEYSYDNIHLNALGYEELRKILTMELNNFYNR